MTTARTHPTLDQQQVVEQLGEVRKEIARCIIGLEDEITLLLCAVISGRHVLVEGVPGLGKTMLIKTLARCLGCSFRRIQFTPDLLPADILGGYIYDPKTGSFTLRKGPVFANIILADEINRAPAKTQSGMLEVMAEQQVTIEGDTLPIELPFFVFATQNPVEHEGVYPLPQAQLDRFAMRLLLSYPDPQAEQKIFELHRNPLPQAQEILNVETILRCQQTVDQVTVSDEILALLVTLSGRTRDHEGVLLGASHRLGVDLLRLCRSYALIDGRDHVIPDDVKALFYHAANHRILLSPRAELSGITSRQVIDEALAATKLV